MAVDTSVADRSTRSAGRYATVVIIGGGCYGSYYLRQLGRAVRANAIEIDEVVVVDRDPACQVAGAPPPEAAALRWRLDVSDWRSWLAHSLPEDRDDSPSAIVPSPLMPHLFFEWLEDRSVARWPQRAIAQGLVPPPPESIPWQRAAPDGRHYVSYATWMCPINCIEPARCPHTKGTRDWSLARTLDQWSGAVDETVVFHCTHRAYGVGMVDVAALRQANARAATIGAAGGARILVATVSHCHGALAVLEVGHPHASRGS
jgi:hypothetical protein